MDNNTVPAVYSAISAVQEALSREGVAKNRKNQQQGYAFRGIDDIYCALSPALARAGLVILPRVQSRTVTERQTARGTPIFYVVLDVEFDFVAAADGSSHTVRVFGEAMDSADKATNKAMSASYKYACLQAFCIPTEGDNDADATTHEVVARAPVTQEQADTIRTLAQDAGVPVEKICAGYHAQDVESLPAAAAPAIIRNLEKRIAEKTQES